MNKRQYEVEKQKLAAEAYELRQLRAIYQKAADDIAEQLEIHQGKINILLKDIDDLTEEQRSILQSQIYQRDFQLALQKQINGFLTDLTKQQHQSIDEYLKDAYKTGYIGAMYDIAGQGIPIITPIDQKKVVRAMVHNSPISEGLYARLGEDVQRLKLRIANNIARGISSAADYRTVARNIAADSNVGFNKAMRIARTEGHRIQNEAAFDAAHDAVNAGADIVKQWDATLDGNTRESHRKLDGQIRELDDPFQVDGKEAMYPSGFGIAGEDINCRCAMLRRARWALDEDELEILKERAEYHGLYFNDEDELKAFKSMKAQSFADFESKYIKATEIFTNAPAVVTGFEKAKTIEEAEKYAAQFVDPTRFGSVGLSYKGVHIDVANEINRALYEFFGKFDVEKLNGIAAPAKNTKLGKMIDARAAYSPVRRSLLMNRANTKSLKLFMEGFEEDTKILEDILKHPEKYDLSKLRSTTRTAIEASKEAGRLIVPTNVVESVLHELGHHLERVVEVDIDLEASMLKYGRKVSGYAAADTSEYFAESLASYLKGENRIDPALKKFFDKLRKVEAAPATKKIINGRTLVKRGSVKSVRKTYGKSSVRTINAPNGKKYNLVQNKKVVKVIDNSKMSLTREGLKMAGVEYNKVKRLEKALTQKEIIERVGGGDQTIGSCSSLAFAYIGNRAGYDVLDYRGGSSLSVFSTLMYIKDIAKLKGVNSVVIKNYNGFKAVEEALKNVEKGKEYYLSASNHAAIIRKTDRGFEYLELQSTDDNGFKNLTNRNLGTRFGVTKSKTTMGMKVEHQVVLIEAESLYNNKEYIKLLGYINTPKNKQLKGADGYAK